MTHCVVSAGLTRLLAGIGLGAVKPRIVTMVVLLVDARFTSPASGSVPVFTDQRSTPHWARRSIAEEREHTANRRDLSDLFMRQASKKIDSRAGWSWVSIREPGNELADRP